MTTTVLETYGIPPRQGVATDLSLPLSFFDMTWLHRNPIRRQLLFYDRPCSEAEFSNIIIPNLKQSLSITLKHYLPVAGNLLYPLDTVNSKPIIRYVSGNSIPLTVAVSGSDFNELTANHARDSDQFYDLLPTMPPVTEEENYVIVPLIALQGTLFDGSGICIGLTNHHCLCDARSIVRFMSSWAEINKSGDDEAFVSKNRESLPIFNRSIFGDCSRLDGIFWNAMKNISLTLPPSHPLPTNRVRASFILTHSDIKKLKNLVLSAKPPLLQISSFIVAAAYVWTALVRSGGAAGDESEVFVFPADGRGRRNVIFDPPAPGNYFGNCLGGVAVIVEHGKLTAKDGFVAAVVAIDDEIKAKIYDGDEFMKNPENRLAEMPATALAVLGSPKFDLLEADFGWGKARKIEVLSLDGGRYSMSLCNSGTGGLVVGMSLPKGRMEAFASLFEDGLRKLLPRSHL